MADNYGGPKEYLEIKGIDTYSNPVSSDGAMIHCVNMVSFPYGAKTKRSGYSTFLGTTVGTIHSLIEFPKNDGSTFFLLNKSGTLIYSSAQGTGAWTVCGNGTVNGTAYLGAAILDNTIIVGDGVGSTRHSTSGTAFTNTTLAPISPFFEQYQNRVYASGTSGDLFYSTTNDATNWNTSGTSDSNSLKIPGKGKNSQLFKTADRLFITKNTGLMQKWDGYSLTDMTTRYGPESPYAIADIEDYRLYVNKFGIYGFSGQKPQLLSNAVQRQFYNTDNSGITAAVYKVAQATTHIYDYLFSAGSVTDNFTQRQMTNCIVKYDLQKNEFLNWDLAIRPSTFLSYTDANNAKQLIFGSPTGQCYQFDSSTSDNGTPITAEMVFIFTGGIATYEKKWNWFRGFFNPGCQARAQVAFSNTYTYSTLRWYDIGDLTDGVVEYRIPPEGRSRFLFLRIYESSTLSKWTYYGCSLDFQVQPQR